MSELTSTAVSDSPAFVRLKDKYKQELVEDGRLNKAADFPARREVLLTSHEPDAWKEPQEPGYQYMRPGTKSKKRLARGDPVINRLDRIAKQHDIDYSKSTNYLGVKLARNVL